MMKTLFFLGVGVVSGFFNPSIKMPSGRDITLVGNGPPVVFSSGLFGTMPSQIYSSFINEIKNNVTIITFNDFGTVNKNDFEDVVNSLGVSKAGFISHSTFDTDVLTSEYLTGAVLCDPIVIPKINIFNFQNNYINNKSPTLAIKASKTYNSDFSVPDFQIPMMTNDYSEETYPDVGHVDILDDFWANIGLKTNFWEGPTGNKVNFENWDKNILKSNQKNSKKIRETYRKFIAHKVMKFFLNEEKNNLDSVNELVPSSEPINYDLESPFN